MNQTRFLSKIKTANLEAIDWGSLAIIYSMGKCPMCRFKTRVLNRYPNEIHNIEINESFLCHYYQSHGVPMYDTMLEISNMIFKDDSIKESFVKRYSFLGKY